MLKIYVCGPTVYNNVHIGNLRPILTFDFILKGYRETDKRFKFTHNITDIDDKIIKRAIQENVSEQEISERYSNIYLSLLSQLNINTITTIEKVTNNIDLIIDFINRLYISGNAYKDNDGNVWFDVEKNKKAYGHISKQQIDKMIFEENNANKRHPADFALWKSTSEGVKYDSPFGKGRPGWHTECVALINKHFKDKGVDIHGGGMDLTFPHHENENIQNFALYNKDLARTWLRCGQINLDGEKMSKSLGNVLLAQDFINKYNVDILKLIILTSKLSAPINITEEFITNMQDIEKKYKKTIFSFFTTFENFKSVKKNKNKEFLEIFEALANYDFAKYNLLLNNLIKEYNKNKLYETAKTIYSVLKVIHPRLTNYNFYKQALDDFSQWKLFVGIKDYQKADKIRQKLIDEGFY